MIPNTRFDEPHMNQKLLEQVKLLYLTLNENALMKAVLFLAAEVGSGALYQARTYTVTRKINIRCKAFSSFAVSVNYE